MTVVYRPVSLNSGSKARNLCAVLVLCLGGAGWAAPAPEPDNGPMPVYPDYSAAHRSSPSRGQTLVPVSPEDRRPEHVVAGMSTEAVGITANFNGSEILVYGAIRRERPIPTGRPLDIILTLEGPAQPVTVRRKERRFGIWVNTEQVKIGAAPSLYIVATSGPLNDILSPGQDVKNRISVPLAMRAFAGGVNVSDAAAFTEALIRLREASGAYKLSENSVSIAEQTLFRADISLPSKLIEGTYKARIFLLRNGQVVDEYRSPFEVRKVGLERWLYRLALDNPFVYGILSLTLAVGAGWLASVAFRGIKGR